MKISRLSAALLLALQLGISAPGQESDELSSLRAKAERGNGVAQYNLGLAYMDGRNVPADRVEAFVWLSLARENGARGRALDSVVSTFDRPTLEAAQQRLAARRTALGVRAPGPAIVRSSPAPATAAPSVAAAEIVPDLRPKPSRVETSGGTAVSSVADPVIESLRGERDTLSTRVTELATELAAVRAERDRLAKESLDSERVAQDAREAGRVLQEMARASEARVAELVRAQEAAQAELNRARQALAQSSAAKPAGDDAALEQKSREVQAALAELESARNFTHQVEDTLNKVTDQKTALEAALAAARRDTDALKVQLAAATSPEKSREVQAALAELESARNFTRQVEDTLNKVTDQKTALEATLASAQAAAAEARRETEALRSRLAAAETEAVQLRTQAAAPRPPDLSGRVQELEAQLAAATQSAATARQEIATLTQAKAEAERLAAAKSATPTYPDLSAKVRELEQALGESSRQVVAGQKAAQKAAELETRTAALTAELAKAQQSLTTVTQARDEASRRAGAAEQARTEAAKQFEELKTATLATQRDRTKVQAELKMLESDKAALRRQVEAATAEAGQLRTQVAALTTQLAAPKPAAPGYPDLSGRVKELESQLAAANGNAAQARKE
ncbi:MAG: hypothetical protein JNG83_05030, partial [Opitutaceae bacterium]|nr:hypothetical protein [Opitutaceae bacterium]